MMPPLDKHDANNNNPAKPLAPSVSTTTLRTSKSPLTPRLAGSHTSQPQARKQARPASFTPDISSSPDISVTNPSLLSGNVTPRSGPRTSRRDGPSPTSETPPGALYAPRNLHHHSSSGCGVQPELSSVRDAHRSPRGRTAYNGTQPPASSASRSGSPHGSSVGGPMFFHADDAKSPFAPRGTDLNATPAPKYVVPKPAFHTEKPAEEGSGSDSYSWKSGSLSKRRGAGNGPTIAKAPEVLNHEQDGQQPSSLVRDPVFGGQSYHRRKSSQSTGLPGLNIPQSQSSTNLENRPPVSSPQTTPRSRHTRSRTADISSPARQFNPLLNSPPSNAVSVGWDSSSQANANLPDSGLQSESNKPPAVSEISHPFPRAPSPSKADQPASNGIYRMSETATSARTERKVLDLEISNSSLLAINRTLEREMRKQSAELRRFRRLSRSGRLSMTSSRRSASGGLSVVSETDNAESEQSAANTDLTDSDDNTPSESDEGSTSPSSVADNNGMNQGARDEKCLLHDLSNHQQLLIASQNMNQTIKRCLGRTENLILEAKKALESDMHVNDVNVGGRVLNADEVESEPQGGQTLLSPTTDLPPLPDADDTHDLALPPDSALAVTISDNTVAQQC